MTWLAKDLRKNVDPVPPGLLEEKGAGGKEVGEKTPYNELLDEGWGNYHGDSDAPLSGGGRVNMDMQREYAQLGLMTEQQLRFKRKLYTRNIHTDSGLHDPSLYE